MYQISFQSQTTKNPKLSKKYILKVQCTLLEPHDVTDRLFPLYTSIYFANQLKHWS